MRMVMAVGMSLLAAGCGSEPKTTVAPDPPKKVEAPKPADESRRFPKANQVATRVVERELMGKAFMPGGTVASYRKGKAEYEMFAARTPGASEAALVLLEWKTALTGARFVASFGGYSGSDAGTPVFVFAKGPWVAGVRGLAEKDADLQARMLAAGLN